MAAPTFSDGVSASLAPWNDPAGNWDKFVRAYGGMFDQVWNLVSDQGSPDDPGFIAGWSTLLDPDACPAWALPYCGMFIGVFVAPGTDEATARALIKGEAGFSRGTPGAIVNAAKRNLTGTQSCSILERTAPGGPDPYSFILTVRPEEVVDVGALTTAVNSVKPAGVVWTLVQTDTWDIFQMEASQATITALEGAFVTITGLEQNQAGH